jgi:membrane fusion protein, copper/silver efflux system
VRTIFLALALFAACGRTASDPAPPEAQTDDAVEYWTCPMHPSVHAPGAGQCPICGMDLTPVTRAQKASGAVTVDAERRKWLGIRLAPAERRALHPSLRAVGEVTWDESRLTDVTLKIGGWVRELRASATGQSVRRGETLLTLYSPDLLVAQEDLLAAAADASGASHVESARRRLQLWDVTEQQIDAVLAAKKPMDAVPILSPASGEILEKDVVEGAFVESGTRLFRIGNLDAVWVEAAVPEGDLAAVQRGQRVNVRIEGSESREGTIALVLPSLESETRSARIRVELENKDGALHPGQWVTVELALPGGDALVVPDTAVMFTGPRRVVFVAGTGDELLPRTVETGRKGEGWVEIRSGLEVGEQVVVSGNFLVAADSRLRAGEDAWAPTP